MSAINHKELRELATDLQRMATPQKLLAFRAMLSPSAVLACWMSWSTPEPHLSPFA